MLTELFVSVLVVFLAVLIAFLAKTEIYFRNNTVRYRYNSFAPTRDNTQAKWFVDGKDYMSEVADAIESAKSEIWIADWQLNPEIFMKRPDSGVDEPRWRLDKMLLDKADDGVRVYILLYWETKLVIDLGSDHVVNVLGKHKNIDVRRHPHIMTGISYPKFLYRWSHHEKLVIVDQSIAFVGGIDLCYGRWDTRQHELTDDHPVHPNIKEKTEGQETAKIHSRWIGKDYRNTFYNKGSKTDWEKPYVDYEDINRSEIPRMPWHDVACAITGDAVADVVLHFSQRYNAIKEWWKFWQNRPAIFQRKRETATLSDAHQVNVQVLRSVDNWSAKQQLETSVYNAYIDAIKNAKHFIYIENQFFISSQEGVRRYVQNRIQSALVDRIVRAHEASEDFHVMLITPLKPEFAGEWEADDWDAIALRAVTYWNQATIYHGPDSFFGKLAKRNIPKEIAKNYFSVYSLRTHGLLNEYYVTEIVYVHSKIMVVDDRLSIIGSANINDRSMLGKHDSEVAIMIEDSEMVDSKMGGKPYEAGKFSHSLRCDLLKEHLGLLEQDEDLSEISVKDPLDSRFLKAVANTATSNSAIYSTVFFSNENPYLNECEELKNWKEHPAPRIEKGNYKDILDKVKGNLVFYACRFSAEEFDLALHVLTRRTISSIVLMESKDVYVRLNHTHTNV